MARLSAFLVLAAGVVLTPVSSAQTKIEAADIVHHPFSVDFASGSKLRLHVRSGEIHVIGEERNTISVEISGRKASEAQHLRVRFEQEAGGADMHVSGGPRNDIKITIRIPRKTDLYARIPFGEVSVKGVIGNEDVELHAGDLTVGVTSPESYSHVDASVFTGEVDAPPFGEERGGLFRSFHREGSGPYRLHAHVGAGQLTLQ
jgi:hypothetical protein